jgi:hypothetical protein
MARLATSRQVPARRGHAASWVPRHSGVGTPFACPAGPAMASVRPLRKDLTVDKTELAKLEGYLRRTFANHGISVRARMKKNDSAEVYLADEFIGIIHVDDEDGDRSFNFTMAILDVDLED